nr:unnamed protein product [Callosobruchus analis]
MPCIKAAVPGPNIFLNPNGQKSMFEFFNCLQECNFILKENGRYTLKKKHKYYGQVQLGMGILNLNKCYVFICKL